MIHCTNCGQPLQPGAGFCASCGTAASTQPQQMSAQQGLAQAGLEVQTFNGLLVVGRVAGLAAGLAIWWFVAGPVLGEEQPLLVIASFLVLAAAGILAGQWITLKVIRG